MANSFVIGIFSLLCLFGLCLVDAEDGGFSLELIHRDSPKSPLHNLFETPSARLVRAFHRSFSRINHFYPTSIFYSNTAKSQILSSNGEYLMKFSIGTPPFSILALADTGSDLTWTQCEPCHQCFKQEAPLFNPKSSKTYRDVSCQSRQCHSVEGTSCSKSKTCHYSTDYGDQSFSNGSLAMDTLTLGSTSGRPYALANSVFGCGHNNGGLFDEKATGIVGLGGGKVSLISQLNSTIGGRFSYCLIPLSSSENSSKLNFGSNAVVSGLGTVSTPLVSITPFYSLTLQAISISNQKMAFEDSSNDKNAKGNIIIDSGTTLTLLPPKLYSNLEAAMSKAIPATPVPDPNNLLSLCYEADLSNLKVPDVTVHFKGADVKLKPINYFIQVSEKIVCFSFKGTDDGAIYGNLAQTDFQVGYDLLRRTVSFKPADCTKH